MKYFVSKVELYTYVFLWAAANIYGFYKLYEAQTNILEERPYLVSRLRKLERGWGYLDRLKDNSDREWNTWKYFIKLSWPYIILQSLITNVIRKLKPDYLKVWYIVSSSAFVIFNMGYKQLLIILSIPISHAGVVFAGGKHLMIWIVGILLLVIFNSLINQRFFWTVFYRNSLEEVSSLIFCIFWTQLRSISFFIDFIERDEKSRSNSTSSMCLNLLSYILYLPLLYTGPFVLYEKFERSFHVQNEKISIKVKNLLVNIFLFSFCYTFIIDLIDHYMYFHAMQDNLELIKRLPQEAICGGAVYMGLKFYMKYLVFYGTSTTLAKFDNIDAPPTPRCVFRIHVYSNMWKYFDVGFYDFAVKYIYKPSCRLLEKHINTSYNLYKLISSFWTFVIVVLWHGNSKRIFMWCTWNYLLIVLEFVGKLLVKTSTYVRFKNMVLKSDAMECRFIALLCAPHFILSLFSFTYLAAGVKISNVYIDTFLNIELSCFIKLFTAAYSLCHVSMALEEMSVRTQKEK